jgi:hypothetical protein
MQVAYHAKGTPVYYRCQTRSLEYGEPFCQILAAGSLDALVTEEVLQVLEPAKPELCFQAVADLERERQRLDQHWQKRLERARIEAQRATRQYHAVEPEDRLVARLLERRWEQALREQRGLEEQYDRFKADAPREPTAADRQRIEAWAGDLSGLCHAPSTTIQDRKRSSGSWWNGSPWASADKPSGSTWRSAGLAAWRAGTRFVVLLRNMSNSAIIKPCAIA